MYVCPVYRIYEPLVVKSQPSKCVEEATVMAKVVKGHVCSGLL